MRICCRLIQYITTMSYLKGTLLYLCFVGFSGSQQEINVAVLVNGGVCWSHIGISGNPSSNCNKLIDGNLRDGQGHYWTVSTNITNRTMGFRFNMTYLLQRLEIIHVYHLGPRNIKTLKIEADGGAHHGEDTLELINRMQGFDQSDVYMFPPQYQASELQLTVTDLYNDTDPFSTFTALEEIQVYAVPIAPATSTSMPAPPTTYSLFVSSTPETFTTSSEQTISTTVFSTSASQPASSTTSQSFTTEQPIPSSSKFTSPATSSTTTTQVTTKKTTTRVSTTLSVSSASNKPSTWSNQHTSVSTAEFGQPGKDSSDLGLIIGLVIAFLVIFAIVLTVILFLMRRKKRQKFDHPETDQNGYVNYSMDKIERDPEGEQHPLDDHTKENNVSDSSPETSPESSVQDLRLVDGEPEYDNAKPLPAYTNAIKLTDLAVTVNDMLQKTTMFQEEFKSIPAGKQHPTTFADRSTLHVKNRFRNIKPYDHSRVSLLQKESDDSMYINANFISTYKRPKYYIAAQGPNKDSLDDFWRMIWEHRVPVIVMVTNCKEAGKDKCTKYWPDQGDDKQTYDDLDVVLDKNRIMADYKIRDFKISKRGEIRAVRQYHYTSWPDEGVPTSCSALISFVNRIREYTDDKDPPNVVHCSAGVGRTGTFIAVNYSMDMARDESIVDIKKVVHRLREDRINMVQTLSQYKFLYALMLECLYCGEVTIPCQGASEKIQHLFIQADGKYSQAEKQWKVLDVLKPKNWEDECLAGRHKDNIEKNRTQTILPHDNHRPYLRRRPDYTSNYINAVFVDGYKKKNKFLLTQHPLENTVVDLWRTVSDFNISTIVMLNSCSDDAEVYWPEDEYSEALPYGDFLEVTFKRVDKQDEFTITEVQMFEDKEKANVVTHIQVKNWSEDSKPKLSILPALYNIVTQAQMADEDSRIMIHNLNGDGNTGNICALHQIFDKIKEEQEIDIFNAVKNTRMSRPDAIPDMKTYRYLHDASVQFIEQFSTYANLQ